MSAILFATITVLAWGAWLAPSQNVPMKGQQTRTFYVTLAVLLLAVLVAAGQGLEALRPEVFWLPFAGGLIWSLSGLCAFIGSSRLGMAKAFGIWAPLNILVSILWGMVLFGEFLRTGVLNLALAAVSILVIIAGILLIVFAGGGAESKGHQGKRSMLAGLAGTVGAGIGFATYFVPIRISQVSMWVAMLPMALGMFAGSCVLVILSRSSLKLEAVSHYGRALATGLLWGIGNYGALRMMELIGTGKGFTIAQLCVVVNALLGIFWLKNPKPNTKAATWTLVGVVLAMAGGVVLGNLKS